MVTRNYVVRLIDGDYAVLVDEYNDEIRIARALLPLEIDEGTMLLFENFEYTIVEL